MALTVETGSGLSTSDALVSVSAADAYHAALGNAAWTGTDSLKEEAIRRATVFLSNGYRWDGLRTNGRSQALAWPRSGCVDAEGHGIQPNEIPAEVVKACSEIALRELASPGSMSPDVVKADAVKREKVGPIETEYTAVSTSAFDHRPTLLLVGEMLAPFIASRSGSDVFGRAVRV